MLSQAAADPNNFNNFSFCINAAVIFSCNLHVDRREESQQ